MRGRGQHRLTDWFTDSVAAAAAAAASLSNSLSRARPPSRRRLSLTPPPDGRWGKPSLGSLAAPPPKLEAGKGLWWLRPSSTRARPVFRLSRKNDRRAWSPARPLPPPPLLNWHRRNQRRPVPSWCRPRRGEPLATYIKIITPTNDRPTDLGDAFPCH